MMFASFIERGNLETIRMDPSYYSPDFVSNTDAISTFQGGYRFLRDVASEIKDGPGGWAVSTNDYQPSGIPVIRGSDINDSSVTLDGCVYISPEKHRELKAHNVRRGDVVLSVRGTIGRAAVFNDAKYSEASINAAVVRMRPKPALYSYYLISFFNSRLGQVQTQRISNGAVQNNMNLTETGANRIPIPNPAIQRAIGNKVRKAERLRELADESRAWATSRIDNAYGSLPNENGFHQYGWHPKPKIETLRIDPWFHRPFYVAMAERLGSVDGLKPVDSVCKLVTTSAKLGAWKQETFDYFEIGGIVSATGEATAVETAVSDAPSRAKYLVQASDVLVSTVRPNLKAVGQIDPDRSSPGVATSGFCVLRPSSPELGAYVRACLVNDAGVHQLMRWNTGGTYPAIDHDVPGRVLIPFKNETVAEVGGRLIQALRQNWEATVLVDAARSAVEDLIDGTLDETALLAESEGIEQWLAENPSPHEKEKP